MNRLPLEDLGNHLFVNLHVSDIVTVVRQARSNRLGDIAPSNNADIHHGDIRTGECEELVIKVE